MIATLTALNPELASWALLHLLAFRKFNELKVGLRLGAVDLVGLASHAIMLGSAAREAVTSCTLRTLKVVFVVLVVHKGIGTSWSGAPADICQILRCFVKGKLVELVQLLQGKQGLHICYFHIHSALWNRARDWKLARLNPEGKVLSKTGSVEDMVAHIKGEFFKNKA